MKQIEEQLIQIIRSIACEVPLPPGFAVSDPEGLYSLAKKHDAAHFVGHALLKGDISIPDRRIAEAALQQYHQAIYRVAVLEQEAAKVKEVYEGSGIDHIPLKGSVIRGLYPADWMRVSADFDVLVRADELKKAEQVLVDQLDHAVTEHWKHHDQLTLPNGFHVEVHFKLTDEEGPAKPILDDVWNRSSAVSGKAHEFRMDDDFFYLYHIFHASVHFRLGGCGIRPVLDTWFLNHRLDHDREKRDQLLQQAGFLTFAKAIEALSEAWFSGAETNGSEDVESYILSGGVFGSDQAIAAGRARKSSRMSYLIGRAFPPIGTLKYKYPVLEKCPLLLPVCWIRRLISGVLFRGKGKLARLELVTTRTEAERSAEIAKLFRELGL